MANNYNLMAQYLVEKYINRISGDDIEETFVEEAPQDRVMVGMLAEDRMEQSLTGGYVENNKTRFESVPSMSVSFVVKKNAKGILQVIPKGLLFYTVEPDYEKTVEYILAKYSEKDSTPYTSISQLCDAYPEAKFPLPLTWKKVRIEDAIAGGVSVRLDSIRESRFHLEDAINSKLTFLVTQITNDIRIVKTDRVSFFDLSDEARFHTVVGISSERATPGWNIDVLCTVTEDGDCYRFLMQMVNKTTMAGATPVGYIPRIFNAGIRVVGNEFVEYQEIELDYFSSSYKYREPVYAVAENVSVDVDINTNTIDTANVPLFTQFRLKTKDDFNEYVRFEKLIEDPVGNLTYIYRAMVADYRKCEAEKRATTFKTKAAEDKFTEALESYKHEIKRFKLGIDQIEYKDYVKKAFIYMNRAFSWKLAANTRVIVGWRLFQIVFIVSLIPEMIRSEYPDDTTMAEADLEMANLLYFPTGGGKTEAFLGACVFDMFFDRLRGKNDGITAFLKYPLRLLAVQQLDRVLTVVLKANAVREQIPELKNTTPFRVGFFVGKENTPNRIDSRETLSKRGKKDGPQDLILESDQDTLNEYYRFIDTCPCCGEKMINVRFNKDLWMLEHVCDNPECNAKALPLMIVDSEVFRFLPSLVVSVVDKMALLGTTNEFRMLFGQVKSRCPEHGFSVKKRCACPECSRGENIPSVGLLKDPAPTLFIQDEMHLMTESLGTFDAHYESFINYYAKRLLPPTQRKQIRFVGATATISMYKAHIRELYHMEGRRFPCEYPSAKNGEDFYSYTDADEISRLLLGYAPYGRSITDGMWQSVYIMRLICYRMAQFAEENYEELCRRGFEGSLEEYKEMLFNYWIELVYNNRKTDVVDLANAFQNQGNNLLEAQGVPKFVSQQMTSDEDFQTVRQTLFDIQANRKKVESTNLILATKTISHGVDEDSFNLMYFFGMPNNNAEYIQAYSRVGRKYAGIVIDIIRLMRVRDRSYLKNFIVFHQNKDDLVESVPVNRWAKNAIYSTLPGMLSGLLMQYYTVETDSEDFYHAYKVKKLLMNGTIDIDEVASILVELYGCNSQEKLSEGYKEIIEQQTHAILEGIKNNDFSREMFFSDAISLYSKGKKKPMRSLRDTEETLEIEIR